MISRLQGTFDSNVQRIRGIESENNPGMVGDSEKLGQQQSGFLNESLGSHGHPMSSPAWIGSVGSKEAIQRLVD